MTESAFSRRYDLFRTLLREARRSAGLTQVELAARLGKPQSFVSKFEHGERRLDVIEFLDVTRAVKINPARFLEELERRSRAAEASRRAIRLQK